jgi:hypothetical protein
MQLEPHEGAGMMWSFIDEERRDHGNRHEEEAAKETY